MILLNGDPVAPRPVQLKLGVTELGERWGGAATADASGRHGELLYGVTGNLQTAHEIARTDTVLERFYVDGQPPYAQTTDTRQHKRLEMLSISPRMQWKSTDGQVLSLNGLIEGRRSRYMVTDLRSAASDLQGFAQDTLHTNESSTLLRSIATWRSPVTIATDGNIEAKANLSYNTRLARSNFDAGDVPLVSVLNRSVRSQLRDAAAILSGKYSQGIGEEHSLAFGWDGQYSRRSEDRIQVETSSDPDYPLENLDEGYNATVSRLAVFLQDVWEPSKRFVVSSGIRWEGLQSHIEGRTISNFDNLSSVFSPTVQATLKMPDSDTDQMRLGMARTYKAPTAGELTPRRWVVAQNSATTPNFQGNPNLKPELSWGLDLAYERNLPRDAFLGISGYVRQIDDVILVQTSTVDGIWIKTPVNSGRARVLGLEIEVKGRLRQLFDNAPDLETRFSLGRNWSRVESVPGPNNRLERQSPLLVNVGVDWTPAQIPLAMGGNYNQEFGAAWRNSNTVSGRTHSIRKLDLYALWTIAPKTKLRLSASNVLGLREKYDSRYEDDNLVERQFAASESPRLLNLQLELAF